MPYKKCENCGKVFFDRWNSGRIYCSKKCNNDAWINRLRFKRLGNLNIPIKLNIIRG